MASRGRERSGGGKAAEKLLAIEVDGKPVTIDVRAMSMRERMLLRAELAKMPVEADEFDFRVGAVWIALRRDDKDLTFEQVLDSVTVGEVLDPIVVDAEADSPEA